jgi:hypothetical protein
MLNKFALKGDHDLMYTKLYTMIFFVSKTDLDCVEEMIFFVSKTDLDCVEEVVAAAAG